MVHRGMLAFNSPEARESPGNSGLPKRDHGYSEEVAQIMEGKRGH